MKSVALGTKWWKASGNHGHSYPDMVLYGPIGVYCELSSLLDNSQTFVTFCKTKLA